MGTTVKKIHFGYVFVQFKIFTATKKSCIKPSAATLKLLVSISEINEPLGGVERKSLPLIIRFYSLFYFPRRSLEKERFICRFYSFAHVSNHGRYPGVQHSKSAGPVNQQICECWARVHHVKIGAISGAIK